MKKWVLFLALLGVVFAGGYSAAKGEGFDWRRRSPGPRVETAESEAIRFVPNPYPLQNRFFTVVILGRNNGGSLAKTFDSVFSQNYENYRVVYIDDASDDGSFDLAADLISDSGQSMRVAFVRNDAQIGEMANLGRAVETCAGDEIVVLLKGEDRFAHEWVLQRLNAYYSDPDLWIALGRHCSYPSFEPSSAAASHLKTFYAALFHKIEPAIWEGMEGEYAYMIPMLEMAGAHFYSIPEVCVVAAEREKQETNFLSDQTRSIKPPLPLASLFSYHSKADEEISEGEIE